MARRDKVREEARFARGEVGVDGQDTEVEERDEAEVEKEKAREQLLRGGTWLGRELLTWLLWKSDAGEALATHEKSPLTVLFVGRVLLRGLSGEVTELSAKGAMAPYSEQVRRALDQGLLVHSARLRFTLGERVWEGSLDAEFLDARSVKLPELLTEEDDDRLTERLELAEQLSAMVETLCSTFLSVRTSRSWSRQQVPAMKEWMQAAPGEAARAKSGGDAKGQLLQRAARVRAVP